MELLHCLSASELALRIRSGKLSPVELMEATLRRIESINPSINAFVALRAEEAMAEAEAMARRMNAGEDPGPLAGIPIGVKDLEDVAGMVTSYGSIPFKENRVQQDSLQVARLRAAGAIVVGKTNTPEFGFTGFTKNRLFGVTRNPWNRERTPGGSSGGSAAAVTSGMVPLATGSDAGGSIRIPSCYSGCFGIKPTYGRIPLVPMLPTYMSRFWTLGPLSRTVTDAALYLDCTRGYHPDDPDSLPSPEYSFVEILPKIPSGLRMGFSPTLGYAAVQREVLDLVENAVSVFEELGHRVELWKGSLPDVSQAWSELVACDIYAHVRNDLERIRPDLGRTLVGALDHAKSLSVDDQIRNHTTRIQLDHDLSTFFDRYDLLLTPTLPTEPFAAKGPPPTEINGRAVPLLHAVAFTYPFNVSGHPAATVRAGFTPAGLPAGLQIVGERFREDLVFQTAYAFEQARPWKDRWPEL